MRDTVSILEAAALLKQGELVAFPTETVYGLGADALNPRALDRVYRLKGRPKQHPVIVHLADTAQVDGWTSDFNAPARALAQAFWPGPLTLILPKSGLVLDAVTGGFPGVGLRIPRHPVAQRLLAEFEGGVAAPSANRYGQLSPTLANHVRQAFGPDCPALLEGGPSQVGLESTIVDLTRPDQPFIRRVGHISPLAISQVLGQRVEVGGHTPAPGTVKHHYAPATPLRLVKPGDSIAVNGRHVWLGFGEYPADVPPTDVLITMPTDPARYNRRLYAALHEADAIQANGIIAVLPPDRPEDWQPAHDRLQRAAYATNTVVSTMS